MVERWCQDASQDGLDGFRFASHGSSWESDDISSPEPALGAPMEPQTWCLGDSWRLLEKVGPSLEFAGGEYMRRKIEGPSGGSKD